MAGAGIEGAARDAEVDQIQDSVRRLQAQRSQLESIRQESERKDQLIQSLREQLVSTRAQMATLEVQLEGKQKLEQDHISLTDQLANAKVTRAARLY